MVHSTENADIIYFTEKGVDLYRAIPEFAYMENALRQGRNWYDLMTQPLPKLKPCTVVFTTAAELAAKAVQSRKTDVEYYGNKIVNDILCSGNAITRDYVIEFTVKSLQSITVTELHGDIIDSVITLIESHIVEIPVPLPVCDDEDPTPPVVHDDAHIPMLPISPPQTPEHPRCRARPQAPKRNRHKSFVASMLQQSTLSRRIQPIVLLNLLD